MKQESQQSKGVHQASGTGGDGKSMVGGMFQLCRISACNGFHAEHREAGVDLMPRFGGKEVIELRDVVVQVSTGPNR